MIIYKLTLLKSENNPALERTEDPDSSCSCGSREVGPFEFLTLKLDLGSCKDEMGAAGRKGGRVPEFKAVMQYPSDRVGKWKPHIRP